jgi:hypothetical protein
MNFQFYSIFNRFNKPVKCKMYLTMMPGAFVLSNTRKKKSNKKALTFILLYNIINYTFALNSSSFKIRSRTVIKVITFLLPKSTCKQKLYNFYYHQQINFNFNWAIYIFIYGFKIRNKLLTSAIHIEQVRVKVFVSALQPTSHYNMTLAFLLWKMYWRM